eukprot:8529315-Pyramimonas_sp.AAC.1
MERHTEGASDSRLNSFRKAFKMEQRADQGTHRSILALIPSLPTARPTLSFARALMRIPIEMASRPRQPWGPPDKSCNRLLLSSSIP